MSPFFRVAASALAAGFEIREFRVDLDRPNPLTAGLVQGPVMDREVTSFTGYFPLPLRHGMIVGELAGLFNGEYAFGAGFPLTYEAVCPMSLHEKVTSYQNRLIFSVAGTPLSPPARTEGLPNKLWISHS